MSKDYGSATIKNSDGTDNNSKGNTKPVQDMIATSTALRADSNFMQNGHIGAGQDQVVTPQARAVLIAIEDTPALGHLGEVLTWKTATGTWAPPAPPPPPPVPNP